MTRIERVLAILGSLLLSSAAWGQDAPDQFEATDSSIQSAPVPDAKSDPADSSASESSAPKTGANSIPAGTPVIFRLEENVNSRTQRKGDWFKIALERPLMLGDATVVPTGTPGMGQVIHSEKSGWGGKAGELIVAGRYLELDGRRIALRGTKLGAAGETNESKAMIATMAVGFAAAFVISGKNADLPAGLLATAKLAEDLDAHVAEPDNIVTQPGDEGTQ